MLVFRSFPEIIIARVVVVLVCPQEELEEPGGLQPWRHKELDTTEHKCLRTEKRVARVKDPVL